MKAQKTKVFISRIGAPKTKIETADQDSIYRAPFMRIEVPIYVRIDFGAFDRGAWFDIGVNSWGHISVYSTFQKIDDQEIKDLQLINRKIVAPINAVVTAGYDYTSLQALTFGRFINALRAHFGKIDEVAIEKHENNFEVLRGLRDQFNAIELEFKTIRARKRLQEIEENNALRVLAE